MWSQSLVKEGKNLSLDLTRKSARSQRASKQHLKMAHYQSLSRNKLAKHLEELLLKFILISRSLNLTFFFKVIKRKINMTLKKAFKLGLLKYCWIFLKHLQENKLLKSAASGKNLNQEKRLICKAGCQYHLKIQLLHYLFFK